LRVSPNASCSPPMRRAATAGWKAKGAPRVDRERWKRQEPPGDEDPGLCGVGQPHVGQQGGHTVDSVYRAGADFRLDRLDLDEGESRAQHRFENEPLVRTS
jgi:hypothetical protein